MKVRNTKIITFDILKQNAVLHLTAKKEIIIDKHTVFAHRIMTGWSGFLVIVKDEKGNHISYPLTTTVAKQIGKYLKHDSQDWNYYYSIIEFKKLYI